MTEEYKKWWKHYVSSQTPEGYFYLPLEPKKDDEWTMKEFYLLDASEWQMMTNNSYGIYWFLCKKLEENEELYKKYLEEDE